MIRTLRGALLGAVLSLAWVTGALAQSMQLDGGATLANGTAVQTQPVEQINPNGGTPCIVGKAGCPALSGGAINLSQINGAAPSLTNPIYTANAEAVDTTGTFTNATQTSAVSNTLADGYAAGLISIHGTYSAASGSFYVSDDNGVTFYPVVCARSDGTGSETGYSGLTNVSRQWSCPVGGNDTLEVLSSAVATGTVNVRVGISAPPPSSNTVNGTLAVSNFPATVDTNAGPPTANTLRSASDNQVYDPIGAVWRSQLGDPLGAAQTLLSDRVPDGSFNTVTCTGATYSSTTGIITWSANGQFCVVDTRGFPGGLSMQHLIAGGMQISITSGDQAANPNETTYCDRPSNFGNSFPVSALATAGELVCSRPHGRYIQISSSAYVSGSPTTYLELRSAPPISNAVNAALSSGTNTAGYFGQVAAGTSITAASGNVANASAAATLAGTSGKTTNITGFEITASGATAASCVSPTVTGLITGTLTYTYCAPAGVALAATPLLVEFSSPIPASAANTPIVVTLPALGSGNTNAAVVAHGYQN